MHFRSLRVINDDWVAPSGGFGTHPHANMEIFSYVTSGQLEHQDSMGNTKTLGRGDLQLMSAGSGVTHSERNPSSTEAAKFLQIWIMPAKLNAPPRYEDLHFSDADKRGKLLLMLSPDGRDGSGMIGQDAKVYASILSAGESVELSLSDGRGGFIHVVEGKIEFLGQELAQGDAISWEESGEFKLTALEPSEFLFFDLA
jgi:redox-sensitive bicupin YhaK (pirin superfamily)